MSKGGGYLNPTCSICAFCWDEEINGRLTGRKACRRYPPSVVIREGFAPQYSHPPVPESHYCGEWRFDQVDEVVAEPGSPTCLYCRHSWLETDGLICKRHPPPFYRVKDDDHCGDFLFDDAS